MRIFKMEFKVAGGEKRKSRKWAVEFRDHQDRVRRIACFTDKGQTAELGRRLEKVVAARANGERPEPEVERWIDGMPPRIRKRLLAMDLLNARRFASGVPLEEHVLDFERSLASKGSTEKHVGTVLARLRRLLAGCGFKHWTDIEGAKVEAYLEGRRRKPDELSARPLGPRRPLPQVHEMAAI